MSEDRTIRIIGDPVLRKRAKEVKQLDRRIARLVKRMFSMMYEWKGIGLAAPQIGLSRQMLVLDTQEKQEKIALINPRIVSYSNETVEMKEGCLSIPEVEAEIERPCSIEVCGLDPNGKQLCIEAEGMLARVLQHEIDHLSGVLFVDHLKPHEKEVFEATLEEVAREFGHKPDKIS